MINFYCNTDIFPNTACACLIEKWKDNVQAQIGEFIVHTISVTKQFHFLSISIRFSSRNGKLVFFTRQLMLLQIIRKKLTQLFKLFFPISHDRFLTISTKLIISFGIK